MNMWKSLQGWKQTIALAYWSIGTLLCVLWWPDNSFAIKINTTIGIILSGIGAGSSVAKKYQAKITKELEEGV